MKSKSPGYKVDKHWVNCDRCGVIYPEEEVVQEWTGLVVCREKCFEKRHPQDFVRGRAENTAAKGLVRSKLEPVFVKDCTHGPSAIANQAVAGCAIAGVTVPGRTLPLTLQGTNNNAD